MFARRKRNTSVKPFSSTRSRSLSMAQKRRRTSTRSAQFEIAHRFFVDAEGVGECVDHARLDRRALTVDQRKDDERAHDLPADLLVEDAARRSERIERLDRVEVVRRAEHALNGAHHVAFGRLEVGALVDGEVLHRAEAGANLFGVGSLKLHAPRVLRAPCHAKTPGNQRNDA
jgi:hypothetical protein